MEKTVDVLRLCDTDYLFVVWWRKRDVTSTNTGLSGRTNGTRNCSFVDQKKIEDLQVPLRLHCTFEP